jgi:hypothetical protein
MMAGYAPGTHQPDAPGYDDGLGDTPPEGDHQYGNPAYTITGGTYNDCCQDNPSIGGSINQQPIGIASLSFINYVDDNAMHLFTPDQAAAMASMVLVQPSTVIGATGSGLVGESYSLTQNPSLLDYPVNTSVVSVSVYPNPSAGTVNISFDSVYVLKRVILTNIIGQEVRKYEITTSGTDYYSFDLSSLSKGIYFIRCNFATGSITRKILIQ